MKQKKGISLIVLVVTIIVMIIIAGAIILSLNSTNVIDMAEQGEKEWNIAMLKEQLRQTEINNILAQKVPNATVSKKIQQKQSGLTGTFYGPVEDFGMDAGPLEGKILFEDSKMVYKPESVTQEEALELEKENILKSKHYLIVAEETKNTKYANAENVGTYTDFVSVVNKGEFATKDNKGNDKEPKYVIAYLGENIDLGNKQLEDGTWVDKDGNAAVSITTINTFEGILDGQGYTLSGMYTYGNYNFGYITYNNGEIKNLNFTNSLINGMAYGGFIITNNGIIKDCVIDVVIEFYEDTCGAFSGINNGTIEGCINFSNIKGNTGYAGGAGGICGINNAKGIIRNCHNKGSVDVGARTAGISGVNRGIIEKCSNIADVDGTGDSWGMAGGIVADNYGTISECFNLGNVKSYQRVGGIVGTNRGKIINCYNMGSGSGWYYGGIAGENGHGDVKGTITNSYYKGEKSDDELKSDEQITLLNTGNTSEVWVKDTTNINNGYPILKWQLEIQE